MRRRAVLAMCGAGGVLAACQRAGAEPIRNYDGIPFIGSATAAQREDQIQRAALNQRWVVEARGPRLLRATYTQRRYAAVIEIPYTRDTFSIRYISSVNLETTPGNVLPIYNQWVDNLQRAIVTGR